MTIDEAKMTGEGTAKKDPQMERVTNFPEFIERVEAGSIANVLGLATSNVALAVSNSGKAGEIILKLKLSPASKTDPSIMNVTTAITVKEPKVNYGSKVEDFKYETVAFAGFGGKLSYDRPAVGVHNQLEIPAGINKLSVGKY
ncbi:TPA: hypothetical protein ACF5BZ_001944 [Vibrio parahaemolyticus]|uniref:hypothetical protein n=1 Tax=Vibrio harveyi group TaxID=717610 RepID=UPI001E64970C|nr:hypothetical protein [Vibrio parahaemolyticus]MDF4684592.1 hypothetical protein [Vibrio parahaemolyticus]MDL2005474.1 hypothetical protein [Vibrio parahaemolyticus]